MLIIAIEQTKGRTLNKSFGVLVYVSIGWIPSYFRLSGSTSSSLGDDEA